MAGWGGVGAGLASSDVQKGSFSTIWTLLFQMYLPQLFYILPLLIPFTPYFSPITLPSLPSHTSVHAQKTYKYGH